MEIILSRFCTSFTGKISKKHGYYIRKVGERFVSQRSAKGHVPPDGHLQFIFACAELAHGGLLLTDIRVPFSELLDALIEAGAIEDEMVPRLQDMILPNVILSAKEILCIKELMTKGANI